MNCCETTNAMTRASNAGETKGASCGCAPSGGATYRPAVDIVETPGDFTLTLDMPGCTPESIDVQAHGNELTITGSVRQRASHATGPEGFMLREYGVGDFSRSFRVGAGVELTNVQATYRHGVLTLRLPKSQAARPRRISVNTI